MIRKKTDDAVEKETLSSLLKLAVVFDSNLF